MRKIIDLGKVDYNNSGRKINRVTIEVRIGDDRGLSIVGEIWNASGSDIRCGGQIADQIRRLFPADARIERMCDVWERWHLNHMRAGSPAQEAYLRENPVMAGDQRSYYDLVVEALTAAGLNPDNGYRYGSAWLKEELPEEIVSEIESWVTITIPVEYKIRHIGHATVAGVATSRGVVVATAVCGSEKIVYAMLWRKARKRLGTTNVTMPPEGEMSEDYWGPYLDALEADWPAPRADSYHGGESGTVNNDSFDVTTYRTETFRRGWGVFVSPVWGEHPDTGSEFVSDIDVDVIEITPDAVSIIAGAPCLLIPGVSRAYVPIENFGEYTPLPYDDRHDLRTLWFATEPEAREHARSVTETWNHPAPWVSGVALD